MVEGRQDMENELTISLHFNDNMRVVCFHTRSMLAFSRLSLTSSPNDTHRYEDLLKGEI
jgi:hypothetical protein